MPARSSTVRPALRGLHLHFDPVSGIAGDMTVAALVDAGVPPEIVSGAVAAMGIPGLRVRFEERVRGAYVARGFVVEEPAAAMPAVVRGRSVRRASAPASAKTPVGRASAPRSGKTAGRADPSPYDHPHPHDYPHPHDHPRPHDHPYPHDHSHPHDHPHPREPSHHHPHAHPAAGGRDADQGEAPADPGHRDYAEIRRLLRRAKLDPDAKALAEDIFARLAEVEAALHGSSVDRVTFHEVGAFDSIADIVGAAAAIAWLAPASIGSAAPVVGTGTVRTAHGIVPVPAPATAALLRGIPIRSEGAGELTTPTGAAILAAVVDHFGPPPPLRIAAIGYGAGTRELTDRANVLRVLLGEPIGAPLEASADAVLVLETNIDDMSGQLVASLFDALFVAGALDVWAAAIVMKKGRPGQQVSALVEPARVEAVERAFFLNSTTLGLRIRAVARATLPRSIVEARTPYGAVRIKVAGLDGEPIGAQPEFDDCRRLAASAGVPVRRVWTAALAAAAALGPAWSGAGPSGEKRAPAVGPDRVRGRSPLTGKRP
jgi:uncharacterized protein (TIGR00299 family) protein